MKSRVLLGLGAVAIVGVTIYRIRTGPEVAEDVAEAAAMTSAPQYGAREDRAVVGALQRVVGPPPALDIKLPPAAARRAAEESFEAMMHTLEQLADADTRVPRSRRDQLYRETNDVFSALSIQLDPNDASDMQLLEDANIRMKAMLGELGVGVPRRQAVAP